MDMRTRIQFQIRIRTKSIRILNTGYLVLKKDIGVEEDEELCEFGMHHLGNTEPVQNNLILELRTYLFQMSNCFTLFCTFEPMVDICHAIHL